MLKRKLYTKEEIILCTYIARYGRREFDENNIHLLENRSISSIKMKVQNIASMLYEEGFNVHHEVSKLTGKPPGEKGRRTNWEIVSGLTDFNKTKFLSICQSIIKI